MTLAYLDFNFRFRNMRRCYYYHISSCAHANPIRR